MIPRGERPPGPRLPPVLLPLAAALVLALVPLACDEAAETLPYEPGTTTSDGGAPPPDAATDDAGLGCDPPETACPVDQPSYCADLSSDEANCGECGHACNPGQPCEQGRCLAWFKGNTHTHTDLSDGSPEPALVAERYAAHGYDFIAITDHNTYTETVDHSALSTGSFLVISGSELSETYHVCALGITEQLYASALQDVLDVALGAGGLPVFNHPSDSGLTAERILETAGGSHFEVVNGPRIEDTPTHEALWDELLGAGRLMYGLATDDCHWAADDSGTPFGMGGVGWIVVRAPELTSAAIVDGIRTGRFYASTGIVLDDYRTDRAARTMTVVSQNGSEISFIGQGGTILDTVSAAEGAFTLPEEEPYVRAKVTNADGQAAWTQPLWYGP